MATTTVNQNATLASIIERRRESILAEWLREMSGATRRSDLMKESELQGQCGQFLDLLAQGLENKQIARKLGIGVHTVKTHVSRVLTKLGATSRTEAVVLALRDRVIS